jgi:hypothetical protein
MRVVVRVVLPYESACSFKLPASAIYEFSSRKKLCDEPMNCREESV